jgi:hypothetical protein
MDKDGYHGYDKPSMKVEGPRHVVCQCDKCKTESQEPVGWIDSKGNMLCTKINESCKPLYTTPQQRTWVGLTNEDLPALVGDNGKVMELQQVRRFAKVIEAKLREKNK